MTRVPDPIVELYDAELEITIRRALPYIYAWLNGNGPRGNAIRIPVIRRAGSRRTTDGTIETVTIDRHMVWAPAPWAGRVYRYVWPVAYLGGVLIAEGEPYRAYDDHATFLASLGQP